MNEYEKYIAKVIAEKKLQTTLWQKIKKNWWEPEYAEQLYIDDADNVIAVKIDGSLIILGFFHFGDDIHKGVRFKNTILGEVSQFVSDLKIIANKQNWEKGKVMIVTTYKLSNYEGLDFNILPDDASYFYMTETPESETKQYEMRLDQEIIDYKAGDDMLKYFFDNS